MTDLDKKFEKAFEIASGMKKKLPPDVMLKFYAYYKHATSESAIYIPSGNNEIRNAFKLNAFFQLNNITIDEAKQKYIELVEEFSKNKIK
ncbi:MAG: acyl-CoA-binding protein [Flavobacteriaceae bacterium]|nr:acyl-CoA-binding protein [Flavobacteriaceae bacterium]